MKKAMTTKTIIELIIFLALIVIGLLIMKKSDMFKELIDSIFPR